MPFNTVIKNGIKTELDGIHTLSSFLRTRCSLFKVSIFVHDGMHIAFSSFNISASLDLEEGIMSRLPKEQISN